MKLKKSNLCFFRNSFGHDDCRTIFGNLPKNRRKRTPNLPCIILPVSDPLNKLLGLSPNLSTNKTS